MNYQRKLEAKEKLILVQHSNDTDSWGTPDEILVASRIVLGGTIDLDPASSTFFNTRVRAKQFYDQYNDGLIHHWNTYTNYPHDWEPRSIFLNPPSGRYNSKTDMLSGNLRYIKGRWINKLFWQKLLDEVFEGRVSHAIYIAYSIEQMQTTQIDCTKSILDFPMCIPNRRLDFVNTQGEKKEQGTHASAIVYVPGTVDKSLLFKETFEQFGKVINV